MGWHKVEFTGANWWERLNPLVKISADLCFAATPDKAAILSKEAPGFSGAALYFSPEASAILKGFLEPFGVRPCPAPGPEDVDAVEFQIGDEWQGKQLRADRP